MERGQEAPSGQALRLGQGFEVWVWTRPAKEVHTFRNCYGVTAHHRPQTWPVPVPPQFPPCVKQDAPEVSPGRRPQRPSTHGHWARRSGVSVLLFFLLPWHRACPVRVGRRAPSCRRGSPAGHCCRLRWRGAPGQADGASPGAKLSPGGGTGLPGLALPACRGGMCPAASGCHGRSGIWTGDLAQCLFHGSA